jgi:hypothetical protein
MFTTLTTPTLPPIITREDNGSNRPECFGLEAFEETALPPKLMKLTKSVNRKRCEDVQILHDEEGWFLVWNERHPELPTQIEYITGEVGERDAWKAWGNVGPEGLEAKERTEIKKRSEYNRLRAEVLLAKEHELTLTREQAFALIIACKCRADGEELSRQSTFAAEIEALLAV